MNFDTLGRQRRSTVTYTTSCTWRPRVTCSRWGRPWCQGSGFASLSGWRIRDHNLMQCLGLSGLNLRNYCSVRVWCLFGPETNINESILVVFIIRSRIKWKNFCSMSQLLWEKLDLSLKILFSWICLRLTKEKHSQLMNEQSVGVPRSARLVCLCCLCQTHPPPSTCFCSLTCWVFILGMMRSAPLFTITNE